MGLVALKVVLVTISGTTEIVEILQNLFYLPSTALDQSQILAFCGLGHMIGRSRTSILCFRLLDT